MAENNDGGVIAALGDAGVCPTITHAGKTWTVGHPTQRAKAALELLVAETAVANLDALEGVLPPARWQAKADALDAKIEGGQYKTWGKLWTTMNNGPQGRALFLLSLLRERHPEATLADAEAIWCGELRQVRLAFAVTVPGFFAILAASLPLSPEERAAKAAEAAADFLGPLIALTPDESTASG